MTGEKGKNGTDETRSSPETLSNGCMFPFHCSVWPFMLHFLGLTLQRGAQVLIFARRSGINSFSRQFHGAPGWSRSTLDVCLSCNLISEARASTTEPGQTSEKLKLQKSILLWLLSGCTLSLLQICTSKNFTLSLLYLLGEKQNSIVWRSLLDVVFFLDV